MARTGHLSPPADQAATGPSLNRGRAFCLQGAVTALPLTMPARQHTPEQWTIARDAIMLGAAMTDASRASGISVRRIQERASVEQWPRPSRVSSAPRKGAEPPPAVVAAADTLARRGELHRMRVADLVERALTRCSDSLPALTNWSDIATAVKLGDAAFQLNQAAPVVSLTFPVAAESSEAKAILDISAISSPDQPDALPPA